MASTRPTDGLKRETLSNGVTLLVQRRRTAPAAAVATHVRAGFLDEPDDVVGISHVLEHMLFKGTPSLGPGELARRTKALGGSLNAYTAYDRTVYYASAPARHAGELIALQADQVRNPLLDAEELRRELGVIIQEANRKLDTPGAVAGETLHQLLFDRHRIRRWRIGVAADLERFTRDDVLRYYMSRYVPARVIVSLVADMDEDAALDALRAAWSDWTRPTAVIPAGPAEDTQPVVRARRMTGDVALAELVLGWRGPGVLDADIPALDLAGTVLSQGRASRLSRLLREPGLVGAVGTSNYGVLDAGVVNIGAELEPSRLALVLPIIGATLHDLATHEVAPDEFERARILQTLRIRRRLERFEARAIAFADAEALGDITRPDREESDLLAVTPARLREVVARYFTPDGVSAVLYAPASSDVPFNVDELQHQLFGGTALIDRSLPAAPPAAHRAVASPSSVVKSTAHGVLHAAIGGLDLLTARHGGTGQVSLAVYRARTDREDPAIAGRAMLAMRTMMRGTRRLDAAQLAFAAESLGAVISPVLSGELLGLAMTVRTEDTTRAAQLLAEVLAEPRFDPAAVAAERGVLIDDARAAADDMASYPFRLAFGVAFDDVGYGSPLLGIPESIATFDAATLASWHERMIAHGPTTVVAVGDIDAAELADRLIPAVATIAAPAGGARDTIAPPMHAGRRVAERVRQQSALALLFPGPSRTSPDRFAAEVWAAIAGGLGGRLFETLRSERSLAYSVQALSWQRRNAGALATYIACAPERLAEARDAMLAELARFAAEPPTEIEVLRAREMLAGQAEMARQTAGEFAGEIADAWLLGEGLAELDDPPAPYRAVTAVNVLETVAPRLAAELAAEGVVEAPESR